ncbi:hypothetical protein SUGI_0199330 [Cryptomeria japonica]|uniref:uncharacterized protein LOC131041174 n=1 Tax=Cryptomeria japonica TaxID=3369 RepID=UPI002408A139|nr:uncharacterized protein LOC131041174 [Cryptomeria japonica]GLJ12858.1 hypothetical protein SUGI_0199330 [Cryptomeria japonica]
MAAQPLPMGGSRSIKKSFLNGNVRLQPGQKPVRVSLISHRNDVINARFATEEITSKPRKPSEKSVYLSPIPQTNDLAKAGLVKEAMTSEPRKELQKDAKLGSASIFADGLCSEEQTGVAVTADKLHQWMTESVMEIVRHIREAPFLYYIFERNVPSTTPKTQRVPQDVLEEAEGWPNLRNLLRNILPDGVILVKRLDEYSNANEYLTASESGSGNEMQGFDEAGCTNIWGLLIQGRGVGLNACYILKTTEIMSTHGYCTQFCLKKAKCFGASPRNQLTQSWLL